MNSKPSVAPLIGRRSDDTGREVKEEVIPNGINAQQGDEDRSNNDRNDNDNDGRFKYERSRSGSSTCVLISIAAFQIKTH